MNKLIVTTLVLTFSLAAQAGETFGGIFFDSSLPASQVRTLKGDLTYLFNNPIKDTDPELKEMTGLSRVNGPHMYNWIHNRVKYIIGENYKLGGWNYVTKKGHRFPSTPLPPSVTNRNNSYRAVVMMSNTGAEFYLRGKMNKVLRGLRLGWEKVYATSPRVGIIQVGEGLFSDKHLVNNKLDSEANKINRLGTLFHEARHSDGHSEHVGFLHDKCPEGHPLSGLYACETSANGSYSLEAVATKTMLLNCGTCSNVDKTKLSTIIADSYSRVTLRSHVKSEAQLLEEISTFQGVVDLYENLLATNPNLGETYVKELERLKGQLKKAQDQLKELKTPVVAKKLDAKPEGTFEEVSVEKSSSLMRASLRK